MQEQADQNATGRSQQSLGQLGAELRMPLVSLGEWPRAAACKSLLVKLFKGKQSAPYP